MKHRVGALRKSLTQQGIEAILVMQPENRNYLTGFTGSSGYVLVTLKEAFFITDFRYMEQASHQVDGYTVVEHTAAWEVTLKDLLEQAGVKTCGFERNYVTVGQHEKLMATSAIDWTPVENLVEDLRMIKDTLEIQKLRRAVEIADEAFAQLLTYIKPGLSELQIATQLEYLMRSLGSEKPAFDTIIASGVRSSLPHGVASDKIVNSGEFLKMDFGAVYQGYHSDITRTVVVGSEPSPEQRRIYEIVLAAQKRALAAIRPGLTGADVDKVAREYIAAEGFGDRFGHGLGHGVGLVIHESPRFSVSETRVLQPGMVITVEPGIYLPNWGGVRIEDIVVVTENGCDILTGAPKDLLVV